MKILNDLILLFFLVTLLILHNLPNAVAGYPDAASVGTTMQKLKRVISCGINVDKSERKNLFIGKEFGNKDSFPDSQETGCHISSFYLTESSVHRTKPKCTLC